MTWSPQHAAVLMKQLSELMKAKGGKPSQWGARRSEQKQEAREEKQERWQALRTIQGPAGTATLAAFSTLDSGRYVLLASSKQPKAGKKDSSGVPAKNQKPTTTNMEQGQCSTIVEETNCSCRGRSGIATKSSDCLGCLVRVLSKGPLC
eukprot:1305005-Amphidinium_carterae.1